MGNQGYSSEATRIACEIIWSGQLGEITEVHSMSGGGFARGVKEWPPVEEIPKTLDWDLWTGRAPEHTYSSKIHPWNWRGWWNFGTGALGDMACHILHVAYEGLQLGYPIKVQGTSTVVMSDCCPTAEKVIYTFPERGVKDKLKLLKSIFKSILLAPVG